MGRGSEDCVMNVTDLYHKYAGFVVNTKGVAFCENFFWQIYFLYFIFSRIFYDLSVLFSTGLPVDPAYTICFNFVNIFLSMGNDEIIIVIEG